MTSVLSLPNKIHDAKRYAEVLGVLIKHGFKDVVTELNLEDALAKGMSLVGVKQDHAFERISRAGRLRRAFEELGTTFIKLGQILSCRPDLISSEWSEEFKNLQDNCTPIPFALIEQRLQSEFSKPYSEVFETVETEPIANVSKSVSFMPTRIRVT